jgi:hypothetical protein
MSYTGNELESAAGERLPPARMQLATGAQVVAIVAGVIVVICEFLPYRIVGYTTMNPGTGAFWWPNSITLWSERFALAPAAAGVLVALAGLALRGRARWLRYLQIGLWLLALASSVYITETCAPFTGLEVLYGPIIGCGVAGVVAVALLTRSLRRPPGRQPRWHLAFVLLAAAMPCIAAASGPRYAYGPGSGTATGIVTRCSAAEAKARGWGPDPSGVVIVSAENQVGQTVASQRLSLRTSGVRYQIRLLTGTYSINLSTEPGDGYEHYDDWEFVPADEADEWDFDDSGGGCAW